MPKKISLKYIVLATLLLIGIVPLMIFGLLLSERSAKELRAVESRYQLQLVQDKAKQIEMFGKRYADLVQTYSKALELNHSESMLSSDITQNQLKKTLEENPSLLSFSVRQAEGEPLNIFRAELLTDKELETISNDIVSKIKDNKLTLSQPFKIASSGEIVFAIASPVIAEGKISSIVIGIVSFREIWQMMSETKSKPMSEQQLWDAGLPITFVVDENGNAVYHTDWEVANSQRSMNDLQIVQEWKESRGQVQSGLVPFTAMQNSESRQMIGAYSTANINNQMILGVAAMQDERKALVSVREMRNQTWLISFALAIVALAVGILLARQFTSPIMQLVEVAKKITEGDLTARFQSKNLTEIGTLGEAFNTMSDRLKDHIEKLEYASKENRDLFVGTVKALAAAIDGKDRYTRGHSERVSRVSVAIGQRLNLDEHELETLRISALLHDIGKIAIDDNILKKPAALTDEEFEIMKTHPQRGYKIMANIPAMADFLPGMYMHHEMVNGKGYPQGLTSENIPLQAKIVSVADTFDAMTIDRPYSKGMNLEDALNRIESFVGTRYDSKVVAALFMACADGQIGVGTVKLKQTQEPPREIFQQKLSA